VNSLPNHDYNPKKFYLSTLALTWVSMFIAAALSYNAEYIVPTYLLLILGLFAPGIVSLILFNRSGSSELKQDFRQRLFTLKGLNKPFTFFMLVLLLPLTFFTAVLLSIMFGGDKSQLAMSAGFLSAMLIPLIASIFEELGWRGYAVDSLRKKNNIFKTSIIHWAMWSLWHVPLFFVNDFYHRNLYLENPLFVVNYFLSILPLTIVFNWIYFNTNRSVLVAILFHLFVNASAEIFAITEGNKVWQTVSLGVFSIFLVFMEKDFFFNKDTDRTIN